MKLIIFFKLSSGIMSGKCQICLINLGRGRKPAIFFIIVNLIPSQWKLILLLSIIFN
jgi:hypothetical protein